MRPILLHLTMDNIIYDFVKYLYGTYANKEVKNLKCFKDIFF